MTELLVGTRKGLFVLNGEPGSPFEVTARAFGGDPVEYAMRDPRSGRVLASVTSPFYGPKIFYTDDPAGEWEQAGGVALPEGGDAFLEPDGEWLLEGALGVLVPAFVGRHGIRARGKIEEAETPVGLSREGG